VSLVAAELALGMVLVVLAGSLIEEWVRWFSARFRKGMAGVSAIVAPLITSAPEMAIFIVALALGETGIAWGSIVSQPFMASTVIFPAILATAVIGKALGRRLHATPHVDRYVALPLLAFTLPLIPILFAGAEAIGRAVGAALIALYLVYARYMMRMGEPEEEEARLRLRNPAAQLAIAVAMLYVGSEAMVKGVAGVAEALGIDKTAASIVLIPLATVVPESIVGLIFVLKGRDNEGVLVIVGEKALYGTFYPGLALLLGTYHLTQSAVTALTIAIAVSLIEVAVIWMRRFGLTAPIGMMGYIWYVTSYAIPHT